VLTADAGAAGTFSGSGSGSGTVGGKRSTTSGDGGGALGSVGGCENLCGRDGEAGLRRATQSNVHVRVRVQCLAVLMSANGQAVVEVALKDPVLVLDPEVGEGGKLIEAIHTINRHAER